MLIAVGVLTTCLAAPAALVSAQAPGPSAAAGPAQAAPGEQAPGSQPPPPSNAGPGPSTSPSPAPGQPGDASPPPDGETSPPGPSTLVSASDDPSVSILDGNSQSAFRFSPSSITISTGETVTWTNNGTAPEGHDVSGSGLGSGTLHNGESYSHTFTSPGTVSYFCSIHPFMKGTVTVEGTGSGGGGGSDSAGSTGTSPPSDVSGTGSSSESQAVTSPDAAGTSTQLPSTGMPALPLLAGGIALLVAGALLRRRTRFS